MGILETIDALNLSDEEKTKLRQEHESAIDPLKTQNKDLRRDNKRDKVEEEIGALSGMGFADAPGALAYVRRVFLSDADADPAVEPETVLLADHEIGLTGDKATGATTREPMTAAGVLRKFFELLPRNNEGQMVVKFSDQHLAPDDTNRPDDVGGGGDDKSSQHRASLSGAIGREIKPRTRKRYMQGGYPVEGGDK